MESLVPVEFIEKRIFLIRGQKVMLDTDLAELYGVSTKRLNEQVRRNLNRFPLDFMFQLNEEETETLRSQFATSKTGRGGRRYFPFVFTEQGVTMLSTVLNSDRAIEVNIAIMRVFVRLRELIADRKELAAKLKKLEDRIEDHDEKITVVFEAIRQLMTPPVKPKRNIGFDLKEKQARYDRARK
jgi:phage regulator Rha-like protein